MMLRLRPPHACGGRRSSFRDVFIRIFGWEAPSGDDAAQDLATRRKAAAAVDGRLDAAGIFTWRIGCLNAPRRHHEPHASMKH